MPVGYSYPPGGDTDCLMQQLGRHGHRPAHIDFFVSAPGHRKLTTQTNIENDPHLWDDFAFGTREGLVPKVYTNNDRDAMRALSVDKQFYEIKFDLTLHAEQPRVSAKDFARWRHSVLAS
jgi:catechol 1,2-dioxygenase